MPTSTIGLANPAELKRGPNMADVAKLAGVSPMTVSRVMSGKATVRASTRKKVTAAAAALNYAPHPEARLLAGSRPIRIGFLYSMPSVRSGAYLTEVLLGLLNKVSLNNGGRAEFDDWRWVSYWYPLGKVVSFKRDVYRRALKELSLFHSLHEDRRNRAR